MVTQGNGFLSRAKARPVLDGEELLDVVVVKAGLEVSLCGRGGPVSERRVFEALMGKEPCLPVVLGSGLGHGLKFFLEGWAGPVALVDKEFDVLRLTGLDTLVSRHSNLFWVSDGDVREALNRLTQWQTRNGGLPLVPVILPAYLRLDPEYYRPILEHLKASARFNIWDRLRYKKFTNPALPRILLLTSSYFLIGELESACRRCGFTCRLLQMESQEQGCTAFIEGLLQAVLEFRPDFVLTVNHLGVDREGVLTDLLSRMELPLASWFVDNPELILSLYQGLVSKWVAVFTWDRDNVEGLRSLGFSSVEYLPLGTDVTRFVPVRTGVGWDAAFVGNSMVYKVGARLKAGRFPRELLRIYRQTADEYAASSNRSVRVFLEENHPELYAHFQKLGTLERQLAFETMLTWQATLAYRLACVQRLLEFRPLIVGDRGWRKLLPGDHSWRWQAEMNYYRDLPGLYPTVAVNFNCTSMQMKGAVNQRVFDVPACESFLLTDAREQIETLFEPGREVVCFSHPDEIPDLVRHYLARPEQRRTMAAAARTRVLAEHTYDHRLARIAKIMAEVYA
ncbi:MAG: hypothetical protein EOM25_00835 [Deltaproteobacteria bacterium]|nr:hypothetical protein [Deltaproteobacteria bacterium]